jgi:hypothetical protein
MKFATSNKICFNLNASYGKTIGEVGTTKFRGLHIDNNLNWEKHIEYIISKLSSACFAMRTVTSLMKIGSLKLVYFAYFHSMMSYGVIFWGNSSDSTRVFNTQKKIIRIMAGVKERVSCRELFKKFNILPLASEFLLSLLSLIVDNMEEFQTNSEELSLNTRHKYDLHVLNANLSSYQRGTYYAEVKLFNTLPSNIKSLNHDIKVFKPALFYSILFCFHCKFCFY